LILQVNRHDVQSPADVQRELGGVPEGQDALVLVWSRGGSTFLVMHAAQAQPSQGE
jgi:serine protease Do